MTKIIFPNLKFEKFEIRLLNKEDSSSVVDFYIMNDAHLKPWDPVKPEGFLTETYWREKAELWEEEFKKDLSCRFFIFNGREMVGAMSFTTFERGPFQNARLGYKIGEKWEGKGIMSKSLGLALDYIYNQLKLHRVEANYIPDNIRSGALLKRLGFVEHGIAPSYLNINGRWQDHILTSKINPDG